MLTIFHLFRLIGTFSGLLLGWSLGAKYFGIAGGVLGAPIGAYIGFHVGNIPYRLAYIYMQFDLRRKSVEKLRADLRPDMWVTYRFIFEELVRRGEDITQDFEVVKPLLVSNDQIQRLHGGFILKTCYPELARRVADYDPSDTVEICRMKLVDSQIIASLENEIESSHVINRCIAFEDLREQTERFRAWAAALPLEQRSGEWETEYEGWGLLYKAFARFIQFCPLETWGQEEIETVLYVLARDNECENIIDELKQDFTRFLFVTQASLDSSEHDAHWQIADRLGDFPKDIQVVEPLLLCFMENDNEYVRRRALMALSRIQSPHVEELAQKAWFRDDPQQEYQRLAALHVLWETHSSLLPKYLGLAEEEGSPFLKASASKLKEKMKADNGYCTD